MQRAFFRILGKTIYSKIYLDSLIDVTKTCMLTRQTTNGKKSCHHFSKSVKISDFVIYTDAVLKIAVEPITDDDRSIEYEWPKWSDIDLHELKKTDIVEKELTVVHVILCKIQNELINNGH